MKHVIRDKHETTCNWSMKVDAAGDLNIYANDNMLMYFKPDGRVFRTHLQEAWERLGFKTTKDGAIKFEDED